MCRMIAYASRAPRGIGPWTEHMSRLCLSGNFIERWEKRPGGNHPDGWGIAWREGAEVRSVRSGSPAASDPLLRGVNAAADRFVGHVRFASNPATVRAANSHPFLWKGVALAHNGTFHGSTGTEADGRNVSDTLVFLERLVEAWDEHTLSGLAETLSGMLADADRVGAYSAANLLILTAHSLYALRNYRKDPDYYTLYMKAEPDLATVASEPLDDGPGWRLLANGELVELSPPEPRSVVLPLPGASGA